MTKLHEENTAEGIAVVGMSGRWPGAKDLEQFWHNLVNGVETISRFRDEELEFSVASSGPVLQDQVFVKARAVLEDVDQFDPGFFGIYPREAEIMDPQHRLFLECAWEAIESAGYDPERYPGLIGIYAGLSLNTYLLYNLCSDRAFTADFAANYQVGLYQVMLGNDKDFMPTRVSYKLNLRGPSMAIQTACSTSLVAICEACTSLLNYQCDMALAGGVSISFPQKRDYLYQEEAMVSADGTCRVFDAESHGTVFGHGVAVVLLKRLADALEDRDHILAVIKGTALNNDGSSKIGYAAPSVTAQAEVVALAQAVAGVDPETISFIEAHGTGTPLGDPIEVAALTQAFRSNGAKESGYCAIATGKTHIGHLDVAAGATGLIKTILQLQHGLIPPLLHFKAPNPRIDFANSPFFPVTELMEWKRGEIPRRAGVSAFGVGGTNAHVVVEEAPPPLQTGPSCPQQLLVLSAKTHNALHLMAANLAAHLEKHPEGNLADVASTLQRGRKLFSHRLAAVASNTVEALTALRSSEFRSVFSGEAMMQEPSLVFMFPGQGAQYLDMGRELYEAEPVFRQEVNRCADIFQRHLNLDLRRVVYPDDTEHALAETQINQTWLAQPSMFMVEYALAMLWMSWGLKPSVLIGHSIGEYVAAVIAESFTLEDAIALLVVRARLMQELPRGAMLAVRLSADDVLAMLPAGASIAAVNSPSLCAVSGPTELLDEFQRDLESREIGVKSLYTSHAFHSPMMDPILPEFTAVARRMPNRPPKLPWVSTCTGRWMTAEDLADGEYWARQIRQPVRFGEALESVIKDPRNVLLEVGPGQSLSQVARQHPQKPADLKVASSLGPSGERGGDLAALLGALGRLWITGARVDWEGFWEKEERLRVPLPTYPFERKRYWIEPVKPGPAIVLDSAPCAAYDQQETKPTDDLEVQTESLENTDFIPVRKDRLVNELRKLFESYSGADHSETDETESFIDLGFDSLLLTQVTQGVLKRFGVKVTFRQLLGDLCTLNKLARFLDDKLPPEAVPQPAPQPTSPKPLDKRSAVTIPPVQPMPHLSSPTHPPSDNGLLATVIQQQMAIMTQQLEMLRSSSGSDTARSVMTDLETRLGGPSRKPVVTAVKMDKESHFGPFRAIEKGVAGGLTGKQQAALDALIARYNRRTAKSKAMAQQHRAHFCDPRAAGNFRQMWKEMVYPIMCARSKGSRIWDVDGNEYIDVTMGFGTNYLGHSPDYVMAAIQEQLQLGVEIGPQSPIAGEVARIICEFTGMERATFCNTGSEAVMAAFRIARTVTGREKVVYFYGDYHGIFDEVLGRPALFDDRPGAMPIAPGIPELSNVMILEYGSDAAIEAVRKYSSEIACVIVEPVQSRHPDLQPREFLHELRRITREHEIALIFDEVITGFRVAPGGAQEYFGVKADMAAYGKVIGGGMPIGVLAGSAAYMDALDGGFWQFGDDSSPPTGVTFFAGTFVRHPLAMAAAHAVLKHLKAAGPSLQERSNRVTARFVSRVNEYFESMQLPMKLQTFSAMFYYDFHANLKYAALLFYYLRDRGVHIWEGRVGHLSVAHTDEDMDRVLKAFQESVEEMQSGGFLPESDDSASARGSSQRFGGFHGEPLKCRSRGGPVPSDPSRFPLAEAQREMWLGAQMRPEAAGPHHACTGLYLDGELDVEVLRKAIGAVLQRHEGLRCTFSEDGSQAIVNPSMNLEVPLLDLSRIQDSEREARVNEILHEEGRRLLDLVSGPLVDFKILKLARERHLLIFTAQMIVCDGWSHFLVFEDLSTSYNAFVSGVEPDMEPAVPMREYARWEQANAGTDEAMECEEFWLSQFKEVPPVLDLPTSRPRPLRRTFEGDRRTLMLPQELCRGIRRLAKELRNSYFAVLLTAFQVWLHRLSGTSDLVVGVPFAAQGQLGMDTLIGQCANTLPLRAKLKAGDPFTSLLQKTWSSLLDAQEHWNFTYGRLIQQLDLPRDASRIPLVSVLFNIDPAMAKVKFDGLSHRFVTGPRYYYQYDLGFNLVEGEDTIQVECDYNSNMFDGEVVEYWVSGYQALLESVVADPDQIVSRLPMMCASDRKRFAAIDLSLLTTGASASIVHALVKELQSLSSGPDNVSNTASKTVHHFDRARVVLVDDNFEPVPVGVLGEVLVSCPGLDGGHHNLPPSIVEKCVSLSTEDHEPCLFFRSGEMGRWAPNGVLEVLGTRDRWVTVAGWRFGLGEIEALLCEHPAIGDVVVVFRDDLADEPRLVAYVVATDSEQTESSLAQTELLRELRRLVRSRLPKYMHPTRFVVVEALPRGAGGRVDRMRLPTPPDEDFEYEDYVAPRNETEEILARIWQELLNLDKVSVKDSFFDLSGQSLLAVRLFNRIEQECSLRLPIAILFRAPTIEQLAIELTSCDGASMQWPSLVPIQPQGAKPPLFLVHGAGGNVLLFGSLAKRLEGDYPVYGLQSQGLDGQSKPLRTIEEMAGHYLQEIRTVQPHGPYLLGGYCLGGTIAYEMAQRLTAQEEPVVIVAMFDTYNFALALRSSFTSFLWQKFRFHLSNFIRLRPGAMWRYFREKKRLAKDGGWAGLATEMPGSTLDRGLARAESGIEASVQEINDHAADIYEPRPYPGALTLFKPHINYKFYPDPRMGWGDLALGGLDIVEMPMNPHAMLVEPYVELLSRELKSRLDMAINPGPAVKS
jgi:acyl transferase domain-containing protein/glutamate-1-semialdehyde aminotransferase/thioesterase domain-containing protein